MIGSGLGAFKDGGKASAVGDPPLQIQPVPRGRGHERGLSIAEVRRGYRYRQPTEQIPNMGSVEFNRHIGQNVETESGIPFPTVQSLPRERKSGPVRFIETLLGTWQLDPDSAIPLLGFESSEVADVAYVRAILDGSQPLVGRDIKYRIACLIVIRSTLSGLFRDEAVENEWLREAHPPLDNRAPMDLMLDGRMENLLLVKEYVDEFAGR